VKALPTLRAENLMRFKSALTLVGFLSAAIAPQSARAQQGETNYYLLAGVFAAAAVGSYAVYRNLPSCVDATNSDSLTVQIPQVHDCQGREQVKDAVAVIGIGCVLGAIWSVVQGAHASKFKSTALLTVSRGAKPSIRAPDLIYGGSNRETRVVLLRATF
jgi:hypothetical protein